MELYDEGKLEFKYEVASSNLASMMIKIAQPKTLSETVKFRSFDSIFLAPTEKKK